MPETGYKLPSLEKPINTVIDFVFYYRLIFVLISISVIIYLAYIFGTDSNTSDHLKNGAIILTGGSIIIGIFYSIINYEHNYRKFQHEIKTSRETLTYNTSCKMYDENMMKHFRTSNHFYEKHKDYFHNGEGTKIDEIYAIDQDSRLSLIIILNYLESISIGVEQGIMDEVFMKQFFTTIFNKNLSRYGTYIEYLRRKDGTDRIFKDFTIVAKRWNK